MSPKPTGRKHPHEAEMAYGSDQPPTPDPPSSVPMPEPELPVMPPLPGQLPQPDIPPKKAPIPSGASLTQPL